MLRLVAHAATENHMLFPETVCESMMSSPTDSVKGKEATFDMVLMTALSQLRKNNTMTPYPLLSQSLKKKKKK